MPAGVARQSDSKKKNDEIDHSLFGHRHLEEYYRILCVGVPTGPSFAS